MDFNDFLLPCLSKKLFGFDCPGCGMQRSLILFFEGHFEMAFKMFPAIFTTLIFVFFLGLHFIDKKRNYSKIVITFAILNTIVMLVAYFFKLSTCIKN